LRLLITAAVLLALGVTQTREIKIIGRDDKNPETGRVIVPQIAPIMYIRQTAGPDLPDKGSLSCHWHEEVIDGVPHVIGDCEGGVRVLVTGIDLNY
jgi:hypothetical protein